MPRLPRFRRIDPDPDPMRMGDNELAVHIIEAHRVRDRLTDQHLPVTETDLWIGRLADEQARRVETGLWDPEGEKDRP